MAGIVKAKTAPPRGPRQAGQRLGLIACHVGFEAAQEHEPTTPHSIAAAINLIGQLKTPQFPVNHHL